MPPHYLIEIWDALKIIPSFLKSGKEDIVQYKGIKIINNSLKVQDQTTQRLREISLAIQIQMAPRLVTELSDAFENW